MKTLCSSLFSSTTRLGVFSPLLVGLLSSVAFAAPPNVLPTETTPARVFSDHMVLPRDRAIPVWGQASPQSPVTVSFAGQTHSTRADSTGAWSVRLTPLATSTTPQTLRVNDRVFNDILVGDLWVCSGQSNMRWRLDQAHGAQPEIARAGNHPTLRLLDLTGHVYPNAKAYDREVLRQLTPKNYYTWSDWQQAAPDTAASFSAVAWYFGKRLIEKNPGVPVGLIHQAIGGTPMESWIPESRLLASDTLRSLVTVPWTAEDHPLYPAWCGQRGRQNLANYFAAPDGPLPNHPFKPGFLFDAGVAPFTQLPVRGIVWYQGESNATESGSGSPAVDPQLNKELFTTLIASWRHAWDNPELPFVFAQLPGLNRNWPLFREMQAEVAAADPHTHMAVTIDVGHPTDVHPSNKKPVGQRLADLALGTAHSPQITAIDGSTIVFDQEVVTADSQPLRGFSVAGPDRVFRPATAAARGNTVRLAHPHLPQPAAIRYGWANNPKLNLIGARGRHPVSPFRTDAWNGTPTVPVSVPTQPGATSFEEVPAGPLREATFAGIRWTAPAGHAVINDRLAKSGKHCLHLTGGTTSEILLELSDGLANLDLAELQFSAERWTAAAPFTFRIATRSGPSAEWKEVYTGDKEVRVGRGYVSRVAIKLPADTRHLRLQCTSPAGKGVLIDDLVFVESKPMTIVSAATSEQTIPLLINKTDNPLVSVDIHTEGNLQPHRLTGIRLQIQNADLLQSVRVGPKTYPPKSMMNLETDLLLKTGVNRITVTCEVKPTASLSKRVSVDCSAIQLNGKTNHPVTGTGFQDQRIGIAIRQRGQDNVHTYRIPGIATSKKGTLLAVYDIRRRGGGDLPGDVDVGLSRSFDNGQSWEPMQVIMDMGDDPKWNYDGIGDPAILVDDKTGTIWVAATWSHGNRSWRGSGPGMTPEETGQFMLAKSDDDGATWSAPINITSQVKDPKWRFVLQGPGNGITLKDGTLVFPAQYRSENDAPMNGKPFSTIIWSKDQGKTWTIGSGVKIDTTEAQVVQLGDGSIMINCRDNRGGSRSVYTTTDLGKTWNVHPTSRSALPEPVCNAGLLRVEHPKYGPLLLFSNPNTTRGRNHFTLKVSNDEGMTWPARWHYLYDERGGSGYSVITPIGSGHVGVLWEGPGHLYFLRFAIDELIR